MFWGLVQVVFWRIVKRLHFNLKYLNGAVWCPPSEILGEFLFCKAFEIQTYL